jgi:hypothetical protein
VRRLNPRETIDLVRRAAEGWRRIELDEDQIDEGVVHASFTLTCTEGDEEPEADPVTAWLIRVFNALAQEPTAQVPFRGKGWGRRPHVPGPLRLDPAREDLFVESYGDEVTVYVALPLDDPETLRLLGVLQELDLDKLEKGLLKFCKSTKARGEEEPQAKRYAKPPPKPVKVPETPPLELRPKKKRKKKAAKKPKGKPKKKPAPRKAAKRTKRRELDLIELAKKARGNPEDVAAVKARLLSFNPSPALPVVKRGLVPNLIIGTIGQRAVYEYRGWDVAVHPIARGAWAASMTRFPPRRDSAYITAGTFDGAVCAAKIIVDYAEARDALHTLEDQASFRRIWDEISQFAETVVRDRKQPTRGNVARAIERSRISARRAGAPLAYREAYAWWDGLPLHDRLQLIDDRLALMHCRYGPDPSKWW